jgi:hypothetical protein
LALNGDNGGAGSVQESELQKRKNNKKTAKLKTKLSEKVSRLSSVVNKSGNKKKKNSAKLERIESVATEDDDDYEESNETIDSPSQQRSPLANGRRQSALPGSPAMATHSDVEVRHLYEQHQRELDKLRKRQRKAISALVAQQHAEMNELQNRFHEQLGSLTSSSKP